MDSILVAENIVKQYASHRALDGVSIEVPKGCIYGLLGPNGAGKTSFIRIINQITAPDSGTILLNGEPLAQKHISMIGYLPEERGLYKKMEVGEQALYLAQLKGMSKKDAKAKLKIWFEKFEITPWWNKKVEELSKGMAQKVQFIITVLHDPKLLILDEPFSGFDPINAKLIQSEILRLKDEGSSIILSTHNMGSVEEICEHIALINNSKKILSGPVKQIQQDFKEGIYEVTFKGNMIGFTNALWTGCELIDSNENNEYKKARVRLLEHKSPNDLLKAIVSEVEVFGLEEIIPSMSDIFIKQVEATSNK
ncbi:MAG: ATP-binding cassette domain-containing protein [Bacteroidetes bacterium]|nr:MAG: ATP-binding cassette domain-containing protein [Bacteroidota bacterium]MBL1145066.1 ATP-binding cassette domain-containing protein [Bacteroidota bacterium]NOG57863.1 ABC transporter ATP-binding protein [Bacteroidota bacterium]